MRYHKPLVLTTTKATVAIQGQKQNPASTDSERTSNSGYEDNE
jgi:hypothetical protein